MHKVVTEYTRVDEASSNVKVFVRARPLEDNAQPSDFITVNPENDRQITIKDPSTSTKKYGETSFQFDKIFWTDAPQSDIFELMCKSQVDHVLNGFNSCCFAYGQTGSGKTYSMFGNDGEIRGIIPRSVEYLFQNIARISTTSEVATVCSFLEIYNDQIRDLGKAYLVALGVESSTSAALFEMTSDISESLAAKRGNAYFAPAFSRTTNAANLAELESRPGLRAVQDEFNTMNYEIREDGEGNVFVKDLSLISVTAIEEVMSLIAMGMRIRATHDTKMNSTSSRSHTVFTVTVIQRDKFSGQAITGALNLIDLAGSERLKKSESQGPRLKEALHINTSLTALGKVVMALDPSAEKTHVPYRDSKLTRILQRSLGGNSYTTLLAAIHPRDDFFDECMSTLQFANRCRNVRNNPRVNYVDDNEDKDRKIKRLTEEISSLRQKLNQYEAGGAGGGGGGGGGKMTTVKLVSILKKMGLAASVSADGAIALDGKKITAEDLGISGVGSVADESSDSIEGAGAATGGLSGTSRLKSAKAADKLKDQVENLKTENEKLSLKVKEGKISIEQAAKEIKDLHSELFKGRTALKHKETVFEEELTEKDLQAKNLEVNLKAKHSEHMHELTKQSAEMLAQQQIVISKAPDTFKVYSDLLATQKEAKKKFEVPLRRDFEAHLKKLEESRVEEISNIRGQYERWLADKDALLERFMNDFNKYRQKKSNQLKMCENEIIRIFDYTERIDAILDAVERGEYRIRQAQGSTGRPTTGMVPGMSQSASRPHTAAEMDGANHSHQQHHHRLHEGTVERPTTVGKVVLPPGLRPQNIMKLEDFEPGRDELTLTKRLVILHRQRLAKIEKVKEEAFLRSLQHVAHSGLTVDGTVTAEMEEQVRELLGHGGQLMADLRNRPPTSNLQQVHGDPDAIPSGNPIIRTPPDVLSRFRAKTANTIPGGTKTGLGASTTAGETFGVRPGTSSATLKSTRFGQTKGSSIPGGRMSAGPSMTGSGVVMPALSTTSLLQDEETLHPHERKLRRKALEEAANKELVEQMENMKRELDALREQRVYEQMTAERLAAELASHDTLQYIQVLEREQEKLHSQVKDISQQLHSAKIANAALQRKVDKGDKKLGMTSAM